MAHYHACEHLSFGLFIRMNDMSRKPKSTQPESESQVRQQDETTDVQERVKIVRNPGDVKSDIRRPKPGKGI